MTLSLPAGWYGLVGPAGVQAADFPLPPRARSSANLVRVPRGHVHLMVWNGGPWVPYLPQFRPERGPLALRTGDLLRGGMEGFGGDDTFARRDVLLGGDMIEILADLGPKPFSSSVLRKANAVLGTLRVSPARALRPRSGQLAADGVSLRLLPGWSGRIEIPADRYGARIVLRAARGDVHVDLLELTGAHWVTTSTCLSSSRAGTSSSARHRRSRVGSSRPAGAASTSPSPSARGASCARRTGSSRR